jgi:hypothetical protein
MKTQKKGNSLANAINECRKRKPEPFVKDKVEEIIQNMIMAIAQREKIDQYIIQLAVFDLAKAMETARTMQMQIAIKDSYSIENMSIVKANPIILSFVIGFLTSEAIKYAVFNEQNVWKIIGAAIGLTLNTIECSYSPAMITEETRMCCVECQACYSTGTFENCPVSLPNCIAGIIEDYCY